MRPTLFLLGDDADFGVLTIPTSDGREVTVSLTPAGTHVFCLLHEAWERDVNVPEVRRGFRKAEWIGRMLLRDYGHWGSSKESVSSLLYRVLADIKAEVIDECPGLKIDNLIVRKRIIGARLRPPGLILKRLPIPSEHDA